MITMYLDKGCNKLKASQDLKLINDYSAIWLRVEKGDDLACFIKQILSIMSSLVGYFWLASSGGAGSQKILDIKRAFGAWSISKKDVVSKHEIYELEGEKIYSDIAEVNENNSDLFAEILNRHLFGIDSTMFFLPRGEGLPADFNIVQSLDELLIKRNALTEITYALQQSMLIESYVDQINEIAGIATIVLRDSNLNTFVVAIGNQFLLNSICQNIKTTSIKRISESEFLEQLELGLSVSVLG